MTFPNLVARQADGKDCDTECPKCPQGQSCQKKIPDSFNDCPVLYCGESVSLTAPKTSNPAKIGTIVGSVVGGLALVSIATYLVWRFCIKPKRSLDTTSLKTSATDGEKSSTLRRDNRLSSYTAHSIASTVLTRASNIIQIAYIPGVTNRASPASNSMAVPPVPAFMAPASAAPSSPVPSSSGERHFFVPGELRGSTYSGFSGGIERASIGRQSTAARTSAAPSMVSAVIPPPPITGIRGKAAIVSLKTPGYGEADGATAGAPPVPAIDYGKYGNGGRSSGPVTPTSADHKSSVDTCPRDESPPKQGPETHPTLQLPRVAGRREDGIFSPSRPGRRSLSVATGPAGSDGGDTAPTFGAASPRTPRSLASPAHSPAEAEKDLIGRHSPAATDRGPFSDSSRVRSASGMSAVIEEATRRAVSPRFRPEDGPRDRSPFSDLNASGD